MLSQIQQRATPAPLGLARGTMRIVMLLDFFLAATAAPTPHGRSLCHRQPAAGRGGGYHDRDIIHDRAGRAELPELVQ